MRHGAAIAIAFPEWTRRRWRSFEEKREEGRGKSTTLKRRFERVAERRFRRTLPSSLLPLPRFPMLNVAVTGNAASGKSTVVKWFREWGGTVIDADQIVREVQSP